METAPLGRTDTVFRLGKVKPLVKGLWHNITSADLNPVAELTLHAPVELGVEVGIQPLTEYIHTVHHL